MRCGGHNFSSAWSFPFCESTLRNGIPTPRCPWCQERPRTLVTDPEASRVMCHKCWFPKKVSITIHVSNPNEILSFLMKYYQDCLDDNRSWLHDVICSLDSCLNHRHWPAPAVSAPPSLSSFWSDVLWGVSQDNQDLSWLSINVFSNQRYLSFINSIWKKYIFFAQKYFTLTVWVSRTIGSDLWRR